MARADGDGWVRGLAGYGLERAYLALSERARRRDRARAVRVDAPVISIGNLAVGGTGKTPCTLWVARTLLSRGAKVAIVARPVGGPVPGAAGDEIALLARGAPGARVYAGPRKWEAAVEAARAWRGEGAQGPRAILVDDGFSHLRLVRDLDVVLVDAARPIGNGHLLPRGPLREPPTALARAGVVIATRAQDLSHEAWERTRRALATLAPAALLARATLEATAVLDAAGAATGLPPGAPVVCLSGIARPADFARAARACGLDVRGEVTVRDHARFGPLAWRRAEWAARRAGARILVTEKDATRLSAAARARVLVLAVEWRFLEGEEEVAARLFAASERGHG